MSPAPSSSTGASFVRAVSAQAGPAVDIERRLDLPRRPARVALQEQRGGARDVRRRHARAVEDRERRAGVLGQRRREDVAARRRDVRLQQVAEGGRPGGREARDDPAALPSGSPGSCLPTRIDRWPPFASMKARSAAPSRSAIMPPGSAADRDRVRLAEAVVDEDDPGRAGRLRARRPSTRTSRCRARRARSCPVSEPAGQRRRAGVRIVGAAAELRSTGLPSVPVIVPDVDERLVGVAHAPGSRRRPRSGSARR